MKTDKPFRKSFACAGVLYAIIIIVLIAIGTYRIDALSVYQLGLCLLPAFTTGTWGFFSKKRWSWSKFATTVIILYFVFGFFAILGTAQIDDVEWEQVAPPGIGFQALMPGTPQLEQQTKQTPAGKVELNKFTVKPKGRKDLFMIVSMQFPETVGRELGGTEGLLKLGRQDALSAAQGQIQSERQIVFSGSRALELELLSPKGAIIKARIYATKNQLYQVSVYTSKIQLTSGPIDKFFDSFKLSPESGAAP